MTHEVFVLCDCADIELCVTEVYVSDIRILMADLQAQGKLIPAEYAGSDPTMGGE